MSDHPFDGPLEGPVGLRIDVASAIGRGPNPMAAFDAALRATGCANYNLVRLSSVIPPASSVHVVDAAHPAGGWGDRLYVVYAAEFASEPGEAAWAGIGWAQDAPVGAGLFVEHEGRSRDEVDGLITDSLSAMCAGRGIDLPHTDRHLIGVDDAGGGHTCALVIATYGTKGWGDAATVPSEVR